MQKDDVEIFYPAGKQAWREWLEKNHLSKQAVRLVFYIKSSDKKSITWSEAVEVALCFGWIDSKKVRIDEESSHQFFSKRKSNSTWSKINKQKVLQLIEAGLMTEAGYKSIETAKQNGSWIILDDVEELIVPKDLEMELKSKPDSERFFFGLSRSVKKAILQWIVLAKRPETRQKRIAEVVELAGEKQRPRHLQ